MVYPLTAPLLDFLVLSIIKYQDNYGYEISQQLKHISNIKDSALYPVLKKLSDNNFVEAYDQQFQGRNRKYYKLTDSGQIHCIYLAEEWNAHVESIHQITSKVPNSQRGEQYE